MNPRKPGPVRVVGHVPTLTLSPAERKTLLQHRVSNLDRQILDLGLWNRRNPKRAAKKKLRDLITTRNRAQRALYELLKTT